MPSRANIAVFNTVQKGGRGSTLHNNIVARCYNRLRQVTTQSYKSHKPWIVQQSLLWGMTSPLYIKCFMAFKNWMSPVKKVIFYIWPTFTTFPKHRSLYGFHYVCIMFSSTINDCNKLTFEVNLPSEQWILCLRQRSFQVFSFLEN